MKTILISCYDINPYKGSESGTGWNFTQQIAKNYKVIAITRKNNRNKIEEYIQEYDVNNKNICFEYYDLPYLLRFWKRGKRGSFVYYNLWQICLPIFIHLRKLKFDMTQHINFHADHVPSFLWVFNKPFIWGPVNHNELIPKHFINSLTDYIVDRFKFFIKWFRWSFDPLLLLCKSRADIVIGSSKAVKKRLKIDKKKFRIISTVSSSIPKKVSAKSRKDEFIILSVGRLVSIKSFDISLKTFDLFWSELNTEDQKKCKLKIIGSGPLEESLKNLAKSFKSRNNIEFINWITQEELYQIYNSSHILLAPSHESAGAVVAEAMSYKIPVICFDSYGAGEIIDFSCGRKTLIDSVENSINSLSSHLKNLFYDRSLYIKLSDGAEIKFYKSLSWDEKGKKLDLIYKDLLF